MDSYRDHPSEYRRCRADDAAPSPNDVAAAIGADERRMHVRAYNYWVLAARRPRLSRRSRISSPATSSDFGPHSVLLDFTDGRDNPATPYIGTAIREECGLGDDIQTHRRRARAGRCCRA